MGVKVLLPLSVWVKVLLNVFVYVLGLKYPVPVSVPVNGLLTLDVEANPPSEVAVVVPYPLGPIGGDLKDDKDPPEDEPELLLGLDALEP